MTYDGVTLHELGDIQDGFGMETMRRGRKPQSTVRSLRLSPPQEGGEPEVDTTAVPKATSREGASTAISEALGDGVTVERYV